jgi:hypothetical protein
MRGSGADGVRRGLIFLIATRIAGDTCDVREEDASIVLLRVLDHADLPNSEEALRVRVENAQRVSGDLEKFWDQRVSTWRTPVPPRSSET